MQRHADAELVIDAGNSRMKMGLFAAGRLARHRTAATGDAAAITDFLAGARPARVAWGSVAQPDAALERNLAALAPVVRITGASASPVRSRYRTRETLGVDRLANIAGAAALFPERAVLAIDLGTCITYDLVDELATHQGGLISPGLRMRAKAMHAFSARLPEAELPEQPLLPGTDTASSLSAGIHHGARMELQGLIAHFRQHHPQLAVVLTGGDAVRMARALKSGIFAHPTLTLIGLHALLHHQPDRSPAAAS